ncbi:hypothetical protein A9Q84_11560 [Halobacteriovorax marinus]|uniref:Secreted protein n=1 Tax=Halobacteriovorax marinus TaxID=97084 RepID=A0A1Y5F7R2_9BACT|nr:hypothetical protein A9Q84_11560 [Halobacteriovorax marinus]
MKKIKILAICTILFSAIAYAASPLVEEFKRRKSTVHTTQKKEIYDFLASFGKLPEKTIELEVFGTTGKFVMKNSSDEVCFGDVPTASLECYNSIGYRTFFEAGDSD